MATSTTSLGGRILRSIRNFIIFFLFIGLAGAAVYAISMLNARTYWLEYKDGSIIVAKGKMWPQGRAPYTPTDMALAQTYAPIAVKGQPVTLPEEGFSEREALDRALFDILANLAQRGISGDDAEQLTLAEGYVQRMERLANLSTEQIGRRTRMRTELAFFTARRKIDEARIALEAARADLKIAADLDARHKERANELLLAIDPQLKMLIEALRATSAIASAPAGETNVAPQIREALGAVLEPKADAGDAQDGGSADAPAKGRGAGKRSRPQSRSAETCCAQSCSAETCRAENGDTESRSAKSRAQRSCPRPVGTPSLATDFQKPSKPKLGLRIRKPAPHERPAYLRK